MSEVLGRAYYYRPLKHYEGKVLKCAGFGAESPEHLAFYGAFFARNGDNSTTMLPGVFVVVGYRGDRIHAETLKPF